MSYCIGTLRFSNDNSSDRTHTHPIQLAYLETLHPRLIAFELSVVGGLVGLFTVVGPLETSVFLSVPLRLAYWVSCAVLCWPMVLRCAPKGEVREYRLR